MGSAIRTGFIAPLIGFLSAVSSASGMEVWDSLRQGGVVLIMRHSQTEPGIGDPPGFRPGVCATQRNLSDAGRKQSQLLGSLMRASGVSPVAVLSSAWCRCLDTVRLAFPEYPVRHFAALDSLFMDNRRAFEQTAELRSALQAIDSSGVTVWVTHQVNITALTGENLAMGEALVLKPEASGSFITLGRLTLPST